METLLPNQNTPCSIEERACFIALNALSGMSRKQLLRMNEQRQQRHASWIDIWKLTALQWEKMGGSGEAFTAKQEFARRYSPAGFTDYLAQQKIAVVTCEDQAYSALLKEIVDFPLALYCLGNVARLHATLPIAFVGSRAMSGYGEMMTERLVSDVVERDPTIISGFMTGVDITAHRTAITMGAMTVGVMGCGFEYQVPKDQENFRQEMIDQGNLLVSEYPPAAPPQRHQFIARNRVIAGLALATVVVEAARESGSLHTAQFALEYGRVVCAVPGAVTNPLSEGTRELLRSGSAVAVGSGAEIISELPMYAAIAATADGEEISHAALFQQRIAELDNSLERMVVQTAVAQPVTLDDIFTLINQPISDIMCAVTSLESQGLLRKDGDKLLANLCTMGRSYEARSR
jgi:DNA processing protein